jgi:TonB family protein
MNGILNYTLEASLFAVIAYLLYLGVRRRATLSFLRLWLMAALLLSLIIPVISWQAAPDSILYSLQLPVLNMQESLQESAHSTAKWSYWHLFTVVYFIGFFLMSIRFMFGLFPLMRFMIHGERKEISGLNYVYHKGISVPFSFGPYLFWNPSWNFTSDEKEMIQSHEAVHIREKHTLDILLLQILKIIAWFNPLVYLYEKEIKDIHEFQADQQVLNACEKKDYIELLLQNLFRARILVGHSIFQTPIQKRIKMMKTNSKRKTHFPSLAIAILLLMSTMLFLACTESVVDENNTHDHSILKIEDQQAVASTNDDKVFKTAEQMPRFPGCEHLEGMTEREQCAQKKLLEWVYERISYPVEAKEKGIEGMVVVSFVVDKEGKVVDPTIAKDIGAGTGDEVLHVVNKMNQMDDRWIPGEDNGKPVNVKFHLPVNFQLSE